MPIHDWTRVDAGIFHAFHQQWLIAISNVLNRGMLPEDYYALPEQHAAGFGPDVLTLQGFGGAGESEMPATGEGALLVAEPRIEVSAETDLEFYERKQNDLVVRHVSGDRIIAVVEIVSRSNKASHGSLRKFVDKAVDFLHQGVHLLILDILPPTKLAPNGMHAAIWNDLCSQDYEPPAGKPFILAAYESDLAIRTYVREYAVGDAIDDMPLFLEPGGCVHPPLEATYNEAFAAMPKRWRTVLES
jgi:hypothetical protein